MYADTLETVSARVLTALDVARCKDRTPAARYDALIAACGIVSQGGRWIFDDAMKCALIADMEAADSDLTSAIAAFRDAEMMRTKAVLGGDHNAAFEADEAREAASWAMRDARDAFRAATTALDCAAILADAGV